MPDGTSVGNVYLDLVVRDTIVKQIQEISDRARSAAQKQFSDMGKSLGDAMGKTMTQGMENASRNLSQTVNGAFSKSVALLQAKMRSLQRQMDENRGKMRQLAATTLEWANAKVKPQWADQAAVSALRANKSFQVLQRQQAKLNEQMEYLREKLAIEVQAQAQKQAAAEQAAYAKAALAAESAAKRQQAAARQAHTTAAPPAESRTINTVNAIRMEPIADDAAQSAEQTRSIWQRALDAIAAKMKSVLGGGISSLWRSIKSGAASAGRALAGLAKKMLPFQTGIKQTGTGVQSLAVRLRSIVSGALVFNVISAGLTRMVSAMGTSLTSSSQMQAALANLKGAAATAAAPIIQILTPALAALANAAATVFSYLSQLVSFFTGKSVSAMASAAKGMYGVGSAAAGAAKQVKEATRSVAGFDELEKLSAPQDNSDGGGGGGASAPALNYDFKGKSPFLDSVLEAIKAGQWEQVGQLVAEKLNGAMASIPWGEIDKTVSGWASNLARTLNGFVSALDWPLLGETVAGGLNVGLHAVDTFMDTFDFTALGDGLANGLNGAIAALDWASLGRFITDKFRAVFEMLHGFVCSFDFTALGTSLATATMAAINNVDWVQAFGDGSTFIIGALQSLTAWVQGIDWAGLGQTVLDCLLAIDWGGLLENLFTFIGSLIGAAAQFLLPFFQSFGEWCKQRFTENGEFTAQGFLDGIKGIFADIGAWIKQHMIDPLVDAVQSMLGIHSPSTVFAEIGVNLVLGLLEGITSIWDRVTSLFASSFQAIRKAFSDTWAAVRNNTVETFEAVRSSMVSIWNGIADAVRGAVNTIIGFMNRLLSGAASMLNGLIDVLNNFKIDVPDDVPLIGGTKFGFSISHVSAPQIPMLANGGVIRQPTLAMMGEYAGARNDPEIAAPQSAIRQAVADANGDVVTAILTAAQRIIEAIRESGGDIVIDDDAIGKAARRYNQRQSIITGGA